MLHVASETEGKWSSDLRMLKNVKLQSKTEICNSELGIKNDHFPTLLSVFSVLDFTSLLI